MSKLEFVGVCIIALILTALALIVLMASIPVESQGVPPWQMTGQPPMATPTPTVPLTFPTEIPTVEVTPTEVFVGPTPYPTPWPTSVPPFAEEYGPDEPIQIDPVVPFFVIKNFVISIKGWQYGIRYPGQR